MSVPQLTPRELAERLASGQPITVIDVREPWEHGIAHLASARHIPLGALAAAEAELPRDRDVVFVCHHGARSQAAAEYFAARGIRAVNLSGGIDAWSRDVDPTVPRY